MRVALQGLAEQVGGRGHGLVELAVFGSAKYTIGAVSCWKAYDEGLFGCQETPMTHADQLAEADTPALALFLPR
ncbi:hypothetical protein EBB06_07115 [Crenobacter cavernae]|uniref:Uncharacterized protein n=1 Tax=Crenobacter cavernae TaxID=2290923 RepID=A0ABY0FDN5_9NEIS|nr:hypothetical protein EBB06_07115 [Crenobacter cavernae]